MKRWKKRAFALKGSPEQALSAIIAAFIAAGYTSREVHSIIDEVDGRQLLDQRCSFLPLKILQWVSIYWRLGLYRGDMLEKWIADKLKAKGIIAFGDLKKARSVSSLQI